MPGLIKNICLQTRRRTLQGWLIRMDNTRPHNSGRSQRCIEASRAECLPYPAYSSDLIPKDCFLFEYIIGKRSDYNYESREDLLNAFTDIFTGVDQEVLLSVFEYWVNQLNRRSNRRRSNRLSKEKMRDAFSRLPQEPGEYKVMDLLYHLIVSKTNYTCISTL
jgi:hypothetical protein